MASLHHNEVDSMEDGSSSNGAVNVDSSHQLEAVLHEITKEREGRSHDRKSSQLRQAWNATGVLHYLQVMYGEKSTTDNQHLLHAASRTMRQVLCSKNLQVASSIAPRPPAHDIELPIAADDIPSNQLYARFGNPPFDDRCLPPLDFILVTRAITTHGQTPHCSLKHGARPNPPDSLPMLALRRP